MTATLVPIASASDPALDPYLRLRDRDLARNDGLFVAEGEVVVRVLGEPRQTQFRVRSLLLERRRVEALGDVLSGLPEDVLVYVVPQEVMDAVVGFPIHRGVLALAERGTPREAASLLEDPHPHRRPLVVGLVGLTNHDNVGSIFRNAAAFGARGVLLDPATCDPLYRKAIRVSVGGALVVPFARCSSAHAMLDAIEAAGWEALALSARGDERLDEVVSVSRAPAGRVLLMGTEGDGLPEDVMARARRVRIDMTPALDSLNVSVASGIALYEATRPRTHLEEIAPPQSGR
ncbi:MAG: ribosomal methyltransferase [Labilithrix sp.]|nr:ribosomal methyltransferase [Labilithrix sp.]